VERTSFVGHKIPSEIKTLVNIIQSVNKTTFRKALQLIAADLSGEEVTYEHFQSLQSADVNEEKAIKFYAGLHSLVKLALRQPKGSLKQEVFKEDLKELKIPADYITDIASLVFGAKRSCIDGEVRDKQPGAASLDLLRWKVDVTISTSVLNRVLEPTIMMEMTLSDGKQQQFAVPISQFHELRYNVALVLNEMEALERRSILKIQD